jgi:translation initiation factor eIF-2B subunit epsilon
MKVGQLVTHPDDACIAINPESGQLVYYEHKAVDKKATIDLQLLADHPKGIQFRNDLVDTRIAICSTEVLFQFQDNFDYLTLEQFIQGVVQQEIFNAKIFTHIITNQYYAARANCLRSYNLISRDIISRWTYPLVPDNNLLLGGSTSYALTRPSIYKENNVNLSRSSTLEEDVVVGNNTDIGDNTFVSHSVIGKNCKIGANVRLEGCYIWDNVVIEDNVKISDSLVCSNCCVKKGAIIEKGCLLAYNCVVGEGVRLPPYTKLTTKAVSPAAQQPPRVGETNLGKGGSGNKWYELERDLLLKNYTPRDPAADLAQSLRFTDLVLSEDVTKLFITTKRVTQVDEDNDAPDPEETDESSISDEEMEEDDDFEPSDDDGDFNFNQQSADSGDGQDAQSVEDSGDEAEKRSVLKRTQSKRIKGGGKSQEYVSDLQRFNDEMHETVERAVSENHSIDNVVLEINGLKFAYNSSFLDTLTAIFSTLAKLVDQKNYNASLVKNLKKWAPLLRKFIDSTEDQTELIFKIQDLCEEPGNEKLAKAFELVLDTLFDAEVLDEDSILQWADEMKGADEADQRFYKQSEKFLTWLREASEGDDDDDGSDVDD